MKSNKPTFYRLRGFVKRKVVSSQSFNTLEDAKNAGSEWAMESGSNTFALSETKSPKV